MTDPLKPSEKSLIIELIDYYQEVLNRQVNIALEHKEMDDQTYIGFISEECTEETVDAVYDHFEILFISLMEYHRERLWQRILKGAEFIDSLDKSDPRFYKAVEKYDALCEKYKQSGNEEENKC
ncbi:hypothetical protein [Paenibacillus sp. FSL K6-2524]|uniref:hypothetical protein n=1 Tax=Paenibacillus sp. FSL K6-2524 TaxID=2954516 RepID=UPI0030F887D9